MASGDTKTEQMLNVLANGGDASQFSGCCNTKTQNYILGAIGRVQSVEDEVEELKNNPDVVDIVATYADLQAYDTQHLTENDIIRVLQDETHDGNSTYYRFTKNPDTWTFIGEISEGGGGGGVTVLTTDDYNFPENNPFLIAGWLLPVGQYIIAPNTDFMPDGNSTTYKTDQEIGVLVLTQIPNNNYATYICSVYNGENLYKTQANGTPASGYPHAL